MAGGMESAEVASGAELGAGSEDLAGSTVASAVEASTSTAAALSEPETLLELVTTETASIAISMAAPLLTEEALLPLLLLLLFWATHLVAPRTTNQNWIFSRQGGIVTLGDSSWTTARFVRHTGLGYPIGASTARQLARRRNLESNRRNHAELRTEDCQKILHFHAILQSGKYFTLPGARFLARFEPSKLSCVTMLGSLQKEQAREKAQRLVASVLATRSPDKNPAAIDTAMLFDSGVDAALKVKQPPPLSALLEDPPALEVMGPSKRLYVSTSLCCLRPHHQPRRAAIFFVEAPFFDSVILFVILMNCVTMAWESPLDPSGTWKAALLDVCEWFFLGVFTVELLAKVVAYGFFFNKHAYLRDPWCQIDFVVVVLAWIPILVPSFAQYSVLRAFRALRPLRALKRLPGMPALVHSIISSLPRVANVGALCGFIFLVFAVVGVEIFKGMLHYR